MFPSIIMKVKNNLIIALSALAISTSFLTSCGPDKKQQEEQAQTVAAENAIDTPTVTLMQVHKGKLSSNIEVPVN